MFGFLRRGISDKERYDLQEYLRDVGPLLLELNRRYRDWMNSATADAQTLALENDPEGRSAEVYLYEVGEPARTFVQREPIKAARRHYEAFAACLGARGEAADIFRVAAARAGIQDPSAGIAQANRLLAEAKRAEARADAALQELENRIKG